MSTPQFQSIQSTPRPRLAVCHHGLSYDAGRDIGCVVCRREAGTPSVRPHASARPVAHGSVPRNANLVVTAIATPIVVMMSLFTFLLVDFVTEARVELDGVLEPMVTDIAQDHWSLAAVTPHASDAYGAQVVIPAGKAELEALRQLGPELD